MEVSESAQIRTHCLKILARREHSRLELRTKLQAKGFRSAVCDDVIDELAEQNLQSDCRFAKYYAKERMVKGFGPLLIGMELNQKGIADYPLDDLAEEEFDGWTKLLQNIYDKKYGALTWENQREKFKRMRFLQTKGFPSELIQRFIKDIARN